MTPRRGALPFVLALAFGCAPSAYPWPGAGRSTATAGAALPCGVAEVVQRDCLACHGVVPAAGAPMSLVTSADWQKPAASDPTKTVAQLSLERMQSASRPMPPGGGVSAADLAAVQGWVDAGAVAGSCASGAATGGTTTSGGASSGGAGAGGTAAGLPCSVTDVVQRDCLSCHGATPAAGAPMSLATYADWQAPAPTDPTQTVAAMSLARMESTTRPMPPAGASAADVTVIRDWVNGGAPAGSCAPTSGSTGGTTSTGGTGATASGLPCDVAQLLAANCTSCHGATPTGGAPMALVTYQDLVAPAPTDPTKTAAELSIVRMQSATAPMPPAGGLSAADVATLANWVAQGAPAGSCDATSTLPPLPDGPTVCTSQSYWSGGGEGSSTMRPGEACIACHSRGGEGPTGVGGTVYPTTHEPNDCNGERGVTIEITDALGRLLTLTSNSAGNFSSGTALTFPIRAQVRSAAGVRPMLTPQLSADCNACHTESGASGAPGRIVAP